MPEALFRGIVKAGRFCPDDIARHGAWLAKAEGKRVIASLKREQLGRTMSQNKYYWGVVLATLSEWSGHEPEELHEHFKRALLEPCEDQLPSGQKITTWPSTTTLTVQAFTRYVDQIAKWASEQGVYIPSADEVAP
jgi:hypothetical protein